MPPHLLQQTAKRQTEKIKVTTRDWTTDEVLRWLTLKGFDSLKQTFELHKINGESLLSLSNESLRDTLNITALGIRKAILREIGLLKQAHLGADLISIRRMSGIQRSKLEGAPLLAVSSSYEVEDRDVFKLHAEVVILLLNSMRM